MGSTSVKAYIDIPVSAALVVLFDSPMGDILTLTYMDNWTINYSASKSREPAKMCIVYAHILTYIYVCMYVHIIIADYRQKSLEYLL